jgi:predicted  nucleic acid-binding Zn-ribbon protein
MGETLNLFELLRLIYKTKQVTLDQASLELKLNHKQLIKLAHFLEDQNLIKIVKKSNVTYLKINEVSKLKAGKKAISSKNDFRIRVDATLLKLKHESSDIDKLSKELSSANNLINRTLVLAKKDNKELEDLTKNHTKISQNFSNNIEKTNKKYSEVKTHLKSDFDKLSSLMDDISKQESRLKVLEKSMNSLNYEKNKVEKTIDLAKLRLEELNKSINDKSVHVTNITSNINKIKSDFEDLKVKIIFERDKTVFGLLNKVSTDESNFNKELTTLAKKADDVRDKLQGKLILCNQLIYAFEERLIAKTNKIKKADSLQKEKDLLFNDLINLRNSIITLDLTKSLDELNKDLEEFDKKLRSYEKRKLKFFDKFNMVLKEFSK